VNNSIADCPYSQLTHSDLQMVASIYVRGMAFERHINGLLAFEGRMEIAPDNIKEALDLSLAFGAARKNKTRGFAIPVLRSRNCEVGIQSGITRFRE
jgi:hypothetical protein